MNYFELYDIPVSFLLDEETVKKKFLERSRKYHPDFFVNESAQKQNEMLELSTINTKAFQSLADFDKRMKYILEIKGLIYEGERYELPAGFLMDMMVINEGLMELKLKPDDKLIADYRLQVAGLMNDLYEEVRIVMENYDDTKIGEEELKKIKDYYYKKKYLLRIQHSLDTFAGKD